MRVPEITILPSAGVSKPGVCLANPAADIEVIDAGDKRGASKVEREEGANAFE